MPDQGREVTPRGRKPRYATGRGSRSKTASSGREARSERTSRGGPRRDADSPSRISAAFSARTRGGRCGGGAYRGWTQGDRGEVLAGVACLGHGRHLDSPYGAG